MKCTYFWYMLTKIHDRIPITCVTDFTILDVNPNNILGLYCNCHFRITPLTISDKSRICALEVVYMERSMWKVQPDIIQSIVVRVKALEF